MATEITADPGWSFPVVPSQNLATGDVSFTFDGPVTTNTIEVRLYGLRDGDVSRGYFAELDTYAPYDGVARALTQTLAAVNDRVYAVEVYDVTAARSLLSCYFLPRWQVAGRIAIPGRCYFVSGYRDGEHVRPYDFPMRVSKRVSATHLAGHTWGRWINGNGLFTVRHGKTAVMPHFDPTEVPMRRGITGARRWGGIGGFLYTPSFPQLDRKRTTWPFAR